MQQRDVKSATTQIEDQKCPFFLVFKTMRKGCGSRLIDKTLDMQTGKPRSIERGFALSIVEIGRHRDNGLGNVFPQGSFRILTQGFQHQSGKFFGTPAVVCEFELCRTSHRALKGGSGAVGMRDKPVDCSPANQYRSIITDADCGRRKRFAQCIFQSSWTVFFPNGN